MKITEKTKIRRNPKKTFKTINDTTYILDDENDEICTLNESATFIWKKIRSEVSLDKLSKIIAKEYQVREPKAKKDLLGLIHRLHKRNLVIIK